MHIRGQFPNIEFENPTSSTITPNLGDIMIGERGLGCLSFTTPPRFLLG